jgi:SAM-dependent methyltransferase
MELDVQADVQAGRPRRGSRVRMESGSFAAPCLNDGPLMPSARAAIGAAEALGTGPAASMLRACGVPFLFDGMERAFASDEPPLPALVALLGRLAAFFEAAGQSGFTSIGPASWPDNPPPQSVVDITGAHYGRLFSAFSAESFWTEPLRLLRQRLTRNAVPREAWEGKRVIDAGCGGGRYTVAWRMLGARWVVGVDVSEIGVQDARLRVGGEAIDGVSFETANVLDLPFEDDTFDVAFSNGVLHHTVDWQSGLAQLVRVLRPGGLGWLYVIERPGGFFWDVIEILRAMLWRENKNHMRHALQTLGLPANRIFYMLDHVLVPINVRLAPDEVEGGLVTAGATGIRRLSRGADFDRIEAIHRGQPFAREKYGVGENRFVFSKA